MARVWPIKHIARSHPFSPQKIRDQILLISYYNQEIGVHILENPPDIFLPNPSQNHLNHEHDTPVSPTEEHYFRLRMTRD
jgi:hypothetical protein